ncbi:MAG: hypothetical protein P4M00_21130 [Azospirillaceae bacterium]|nr:hypothetical protein [Azospirillaceae bacterium]
MFVRRLSRRHFGAVTTASLLALAVPAWAEDDSDNDDADNKENTDTDSSAGGIAVGNGERTVTVGGKSLRLFTYKPPAYVDGPMVIVCHGVQRNAGTYRNNARVIANRHDALIVAPEFDREQFSRVDYQSAGIGDGLRVAHGGWMTDMLRRVVDEVREQEDRPDMPVFLIGHAAGAQFVMKFAAFDTLGFRRIVAANASSYLLPTREVAFPYGFGALPASHSDEAAIARYLAAPLTLYLGTEDRLEREARWVREDLDDSAAARAQGASPYERGLRSFDFARSVAADKGVSFGWRLVEAPGVSHTSKQMFESRQSSVALFGV